MVGVISSFLYIKTYPLQINIKPKALQIEPEYFQKITKNWLGQSHSKAVAQWSHHLWTTAPDESTPRLSLNFLENPDLFSIIFPGYPPEMRIDNDLWTIYFNRNFDQKIQLKKISDFSKHVLLVPLPWLGCLDIYQKYGADILILGASDAAQGIMVDLLAEKQNPKFSNARVLTCSTPGA